MSETICSISKYTLICRKKICYRISIVNSQTSARVAAEWLLRQRISGSAVLSADEQRLSAPRHPGEMAIQPEELLRHVDHIGPHWSTLDPKTFPFSIVGNISKLFFHLFPSFSTIHKPLLHVKEQVKTYRLDPEEADGRGGPCGGHAPLAATEAAQARERKREVATSAPWIKSLQVTKVSLNLTKLRRLWTCLNFDFQRLTSFEAKATA